MAAVLEEVEIFSGIEVVVGLEGAGSVVVGVADIVLDVFVWMARGLLAHLELTVNFHT